MKKKQVVETGPKAPMREIIDSLRRNPIGGARYIELVEWNGWYYAGASLGATLRCYSDAVEMEMVGDWPIARIRQTDLIKAMRKLLADRIGVVVLDWFPVIEDDNHDDDD